MHPTPVGVSGPKIGSNAPNLGGGKQCQGGKNAPDSGGNYMA
ncbi:hypothetical protein KSB_79430 [Ktedonobacter robiniae]|uniref:Uncharacterized protein n=1 Tax=Ktedonobacter robiniae TaxID=2778365 RepID=A0ABQ3V3A3_9CHLR|nr:hypothetical protein KSB_79430 [Ktedonobacter robiniae]